MTSHHKSRATWFVREFGENGEIEAATEACCEAEAIAAALDHMTEIPADHYLGLAAFRGGAPVVLFYTDSELGVRAAVKWGRADGDGIVWSGRRRTKTEILEVWVAKRLRQLSRAGLIH
jgi:hypothetical protein